MENCVRRENPQKLQKDCQKIDFRDYQLNKEVDRRRSFIDNNWCNKHVQFDDLALFGLYFYKKPDHVKCYFCSIDLSDFEPGDDVLKEHLKFSPNCPLLRRRKTLNIPWDAKELDKILPPESIDECGSKRKKSRVEDDVAYPEYRLPSARLKSFEYWPIGIKQKPADLIEAGFFYSGQSDITVCFSCGVYIGKWEKNDDPWLEHKNLMVKECSYLKMNQDQVTHAEKKVELMKQSSSGSDQSSKSEAVSSETKIDFDTCCKICMAKKSSVVFLPCQHVAVCGSCLFGIGENCPICRSPIEKTIPLIYS